MNVVQPSVLTPLYDPSQPFNKPHILSDIVGFTHDPVASSAQGFREDQIWVICRFLPATYNEKKLVNYRSVRSSIEESVYLRFPVRQFPDLKEGSIWSSTLQGTESVRTNLDRFQAVLDSQTAQFIWHIDDYEQHLWFEEAVSQLGGLAHIPVPRIQVDGFLRNKRSSESGKRRTYEPGEYKTTFVLSCSDVLRYLVDGSSELVVALLNGASQSPIDLLFKERPQLLDTGIFQARSRYARNDGKIGAANVLLGLLLHGERVHQLISKCGTLLLKRLLVDKPWSISPVMLPLPFEGEFAVEFLGNEVDLNREILDPDLQFLAGIDQQLGYQVVRLARIVAPLLTDKVNLILPEKLRRKAKRAGDGVPVIEKAQPVKIHGAVNTPPSPETQEHLETLGGDEAEAISPYQRVKFRVTREKHEEQTTGPSYMVTAKDEEKASFGEPKETGEHHVAQSYVPDLKEKVVRSDEPVEVGPGREIYGRCPGPFPKVHHLTLTPDDNGQFVIGDDGILMGAEISFPLPDLAAVLRNIHHSGQANVHTLGEDWVPLHSGVIGLLEFPSEWKKTMGLGTREKTRNLCALVARIENKNIPKILFCLERRYVPSENTYKGRPNFMIKPKVAAGITIGDIVDILYCSVLTESGDNDRNGWPSDNELVKATGVSQRLRLKDASVATMADTVQSMLEIVG
ncbi:hypothetical protein [Thalassospira xiamenensis]|uniref:Uncharacterized protein n=1 Tax=Thalassospira xiamenensis TaxID=220697 RepID=A0A367XAF3_9PROT|nr:hypothetical protein [Thalassospira xiamenensis]KZB53028.1 hypothetical protein AUP41_03050 [Thalassospira xiamenensis]RCK50646.1 hypothetical protein TH44_11765 [Thalassospira xiamenensis]